MDAEEAASGVEDEVVAAGGVGAEHGETEGGGAGHEDKFGDFAEFAKRRRVHHRGTESTEKKWAKENAAEAAA